MEIEKLLDQDYRPPIPELRCESPDDEQWLTLHRLVMGHLDSLREIEYLYWIHFRFVDPQSGRPASVHIRQETGWGYEITVTVPDLAPKTLMDIVEGPDFGPEAQTRLPGRHCVKIQLAAKKELSKEDLELRKRLGIPSPGRRRYAWPRFREKMPGFAESTLTRENAEILPLVFMLAERLLAAKQPHSIRGKAFQFTLEKGANPERPSSWKMCRSSLGDLIGAPKDAIAIVAANFGLDFLPPGAEEPEPEDEAESIEGPDTWLVDLSWLATKIPCPGGAFYPRFFNILRSDVEGPDSLGSRFLSPLDDLARHAVECFRETLKQAESPPKHVIFSPETDIPALEEECESRNIKVVRSSSRLSAAALTVEDLADLPAGEIASVFGVEQPATGVAVVKVALKDASPPIWRLLRLPGDTTLIQLHYYIQDVMDWDNDHLYEFSVTKGRQREPFPKPGEAPSSLPSESSATIQSLYAEGIKKPDYIYDFGDWWHHQITIKSISPPKEGETVPALIGGKGAAPPEDCGGIHNFSHYRRELAEKNIELTDDNWMLRAIAEADFDFTEEVPLFVASDASPLQNDFMDLM